MSRGVGHRHGSGLALLWLWLWRRPAAIAPIQPLAWQPPCAAGAAPVKAKRPKKTKNKTKQKKRIMARGVLLILGKSRPDSGPALATTTSYLKSEPQVAEDSGLGETWSLQ